MPRLVYILFLLIFTYSCESDQRKTEIICSGDLSDIVLVIPGSSYDAPDTLKNLSDKYRIQDTVNNREFYFEFGLPIWGCKLPSSEHRLYPTSFMNDYIIEKHWFEFSDKTEELVISAIGYGKEKSEIIDLVCERKIYLEYGTLLFQIKYRKVERDKLDYLLDEAKMNISSILIKDYKLTDKLKRIIKIRKRYKEEPR